MPAYRYIFLDAYPLGNAAIPLAKAGATPSEAARCRRWMRDCEAAGVTFFVPAIAYYEEDRDLYQRGATAKVARFQAFCFDPGRFIPLTTDHLTQPARLWAELRNQGLPTADKQALDADAILAAQVLSLNLPTHDYVVVTRNANHLPRFGLPIEQWENIVP